MNRSRAPLPLLLLISLWLALPAPASAERIGDWSGTLSLDFTSSGGVQGGNFEERFRTSIEIGETGSNLTIRTDWWWPLGGRVDATYVATQTDPACPDCFEPTVERTCRRNLAVNGSERDAVRIFKDLPQAETGDSYLILPFVMRATGTEQCNAAPPTAYEDFLEFPRGVIFRPGFDDFAPIDSAGLSMLPRLAPAGPDGPQRLRGDKLRWRGTQTKQDGLDRAIWSYDLVFDPPFDKCSSLATRIKKAKVRVSTAEQRLASAVGDRAENRARKRLREETKKLRRLQRSRRSSC